MAEYESIQELLTFAKGEPDAHLHLSEAFAALLDIAQGSGDLSETLAMIERAVAENKEAFERALEAAQETWEDRLEEHDKAVGSHTALLNRHSTLEARVDRLESMLSNDISGNGFMVGFESLGDVDVEGVHNADSQRIEF